MQAESAPSTGSWQLQFSLLTPLSWEQCPCFPITTFSTKMFLWGMAKLILSFNKYVLTIYYAIAWGLMVGISQYPEQIPTFMDLTLQ